MDDQLGFQMAYQLHISVEGLDLLFHRSYVHEQNLPIEDF
jgi:hypothetical protein